MVRTETTQIGLEALNPVEIKPGIVLKQGVYPGVRIVRHLETHQGLSEVGGGAQYKIILTAEQLVEMGDKPQRSLSGEDIDVTKAVRALELTVVS
jgi:hypothetical protein